MRGSIEIVIRLTFPLGLVALLAGVAGCGAGTQLHGTIDHYEVGHYNQTAAGCNELAPAEQEFEGKARVRYLVYCGLAHYQLGHRHEAHDLLARGSSAYLQGSAGWLKPAVLDQMIKALDDLEAPAEGESNEGALSEAGGDPVPGAL